MVSVCIATYNGEKFIKEQIASVLHQLDTSDEIIISDNQSTDETVKIIQSFNDPRIKIFINPSQEGYTYNFENALSKATGQYIFLADQDDVWVENKVKGILPYLKGNVLVLTDAFITDACLNKTGRLLSDWRKYRKGYIRNLYKGAYTGCTMAFTQEMKQYFLPIPKGLLGHDVWIGLLSELKFEVTYLNDPLIFYRRHTSNTSTAGEKSRNSYWFMLKYRLDFAYYSLIRYLTKV